MAISCDNLIYNCAPPRHFWPNTNYGYVEYMKLLSPPRYSWATGVVWNQHDAALKVINNFDIPIRIKEVKLKTVACDSGGKAYWAFGGLVTTPCIGAGADYYMLIAVQNPGESMQYSPQVIANPAVKPISGTNMNSAGSSTQSAAFGYPNPNFTPDKLLQFRNFQILDCPEIAPGGTAYIIFGIDTATLYKPGAKPTIYNTTIRFILDFNEMGITIEEGNTYYVWKYIDPAGLDKSVSNPCGKTGAHWHLVRPVEMLGADRKWTDIEKVIVP